MKFVNFFFQNLTSETYCQEKKWLCLIDLFLKKLIRTSPLIILLFAVFLSPSFNMGKLPGGKDIEIRLEDLLIAFFGFFWILNFLISGKNKVKTPPLFLPILIWLGFGFISLIINLAFENLSFERGFFYFLKEIEIFLFYFYFFCRLKTASSVNFILKIILFLTGLNVFYVFYQIIFGKQVGEYGAAALSEWGAFPTGGFFLILFIFFLNIFFYWQLPFKSSKIKKLFLGIFVSLIPIGVFGSASKTAFLALIFSLLLIFFLTLVKKKTLKILLLFVLVIVILSIIFVAFSKEIPNSASRATKYRVWDIFSLETLKENLIYGRLVFIEKNLREAIAEKWFLLPLIGLGKGYVGEAHNQYVRNFIETGILGSLAFLFLIFIILKKSFKKFLKEKKSLKIALAGGLFVSTIAALFISLATEPFMVVKVSEVYWIFTAITMAAFKVDNYGKSKQNKS